MKKLLFLLALISASALGQTIGPAPGGMPANASASTLTLSDHLGLGVASLYANSTNPYMQIGSVINAGFAPYGLELNSSGVFTFSGTTAAYGATDTGISRGAAGVIDFGNGIAGDTSGTISASKLILNGPTTATFAGDYGNGFSLRIGANRLLFMAPTFGIGIAVLSNDSIQFSNNTTDVTSPDTGLSRGGVGILDVGNGTVGDTSATLHAAIVQTNGYTVATLPAADIGARAYVTDQATACATAGAALTGGGSVVCPVFHNATTWVGD